MENSLVRLGEFTYPLAHHKLKVWLILEDLYLRIREAAESGNGAEFVDFIYSYLSAAFSIRVVDLEVCAWHDLIKAFTADHNHNRPNIDFPVLRLAKEKQKSTENGWEYSERNWFMWLHLLAKVYGWSIEYIANLEVNNAIALLQEILVEDQLDREFQWSMSEIAYPYNENTKKSKFQPLDRPEWMQPVPKEVKTVKIRTSDLPVGLVLRWDKDKNAYTKSQ